MQFSIHKCKFVIIIDAADHPSIVILQAVPSLNISLSNIHPVYPQAQNMILTFHPAFNTRAASIETKLTI